ncbi:ankyrin repeat domain-containing protein [Hymenobacter koreensis]|uniref:Ankyrin repeat domain-containing protein n=1 Tax=Hymenobacter koreensis TaxID=1084523 RepID=A0ABP8IU55_9BACT
MKPIFTLLAALLLFAGTTASAQSRDQKLYEAVSKNQVSKVAKLIEEGANVNYTFRMNNAFFITTLMQATMKNYTDVATLLLNHGADVNAVDGFKMTPLMWAAHNGNVPLAQLLVEKGAKPDANDGQGNTALKAAQDQKHADMIAYLESLGVK